MTMDLAGVITDPDFYRPFTLIRSERTVDDHGRTVLATTSSEAWGVILPATDKQLERLPEGDRNAETLAVYCLQLLTSGTATLAADMIIWQGGDYEIFQVQDWMAAAGYCVALMRSTSMQGREVP